MGNAAYGIQNPICMAPQRSGSRRLEDEEDRGPWPVSLHVYNCGKLSGLMAANSFLRVLGTGAFHCGVEVHGAEWSYESSGICCCWPRHSSKHIFFESVPMGEVSLTELEVYDIIRSLKEEWGDSCYDILEHNCCHFCDALCRRLGVGGVPSWVTNLAQAGSAARDTLNVASCGCCRSLIGTGLEKTVDTLPKETEEPVKTIDLVPAMSWSTRPTEASAKMGLVVPRHRATFRM
mmetsp:Transcript_81532/g.251671  ORF Transcript_81532/g.251671 Transcript_81532/m.251671 type:complete len:234 (-) Transcript_81532:53-754(-)